MSFWSIVVYLLFAIIWAAIVVAVIAYVKHWAKRKNSISVSSAMTQGYYFKRYVPPSLYQKFDPENIPVLDKSNTRIRLIERTLIVCTIVIGSLLIIFPLYLHMDKYLLNGDLDHSETINVNDSSSKQTKLDDFGFVHVGGKE